MMALPCPPKASMPTTLLCLPTEVLLLCLPTEVLLLVLWKCSARDLVRMAQTCKVLAEHTQSVAPQMLHDLCAAATTRAAAAAGVDTLQRLAWFCGRRPVIPYSFWNSVRDRKHAWSAADYDLPVDYDALERIFLVFHDAVSEDGLGYRDDDAQYEDFMRALCMFADNSTDVPCGFYSQHIHFQHVNQALRFIFETPTGCATCRKRLESAAPEAVTVNFPGVPTGAWSYLPDLPDSDQEDDDPTPDVEHSGDAYGESAMEAIDRRDAERDRLGDGMGVSYCDKWYPSVDHIFEDETAFFADKRNTSRLESIENRVLHVARACSSRLCCHQRCDCRLADGIFDMARGERGRPIVPGNPIVPVDEIAHRIACELLTERGRPCSCPMVLEMRQQWASFEEWRRAGLASKMRRKRQMLNGQTTTPLLLQRAATRAGMDEPGLQENVPMPQLVKGERIWERYGSW